MIVLLSVLMSSVSFAGLGDQASSIATDQKILSAKRANADVYQKYSVQEMVSDATTLKEYINNNGVIFAITWQGLDHPDLSVVLSSYYDRYQVSAKEQPRTPGQRHRNVKREDLVVQKWGQMRNLRGRAYDPSLIPSGVSLDEIK